MKKINVQQLSSQPTTKIPIVGGKKLTERQLVISLLSMKGAAEDKEEAVRLAGELFFLVEEFPCGLDSAVDEIEPHSSTHNSILAQMDEEIARLGLR